MSFLLRLCACVTLWFVVTTCIVAPSRYAPKKPRKTRGRRSSTVDFGELPDEQSRALTHHFERDEKVVRHLDLTDNVPPIYTKICLESNLFLVAVLPPALAFMSYPWFATSFSEFVAGISRWQSVDGNSFAVQLLRPTIGGVIMPTLSIALGTLLATTINVLRDRQVQIRASLNKEACELRLLRAALQGAFGTAQHAGRRRRALSYLRTYTRGIVVESSYGGLESIEAVQLNGGVAKNELERLQAMLHGVDGAAASRDHAVASCTSQISSLNGHRSTRIAYILGGFPTTHWALIGSLATSIIIAFFIETNQDVLQFLNSFQLRTCFSMIIAVCSGTTALCVDLADPFRGGYSVSTTVHQLVDLERTLTTDIASAQASLSRRALQGDIEASNASDRKEHFDDGRDWTTVQTVYFHLLNSALGSQVRAIGDVGAWASRRANRLFSRKKESQPSVFYTSYSSPTSYQRRSKKDRDLDAKIVDVRLPSNRRRKNKERRQ